MRLDVKFSESNMRMNVEFAGYQKVTSQKEADPYTGAYEITPAVESQTLPTAQKLMTADMTINAIPYFETSNEHNGETVYIGSEVEIYGD